MSKKQANFQIIKNWLKELERSPYEFERFNSCLPGTIDPLAVISKMSVMEMTLLIRLMGGFNAHGHNEARKFRRSLLQDRFNKPVYERRVQFRVVS